MAIKQISQHEPRPVLLGIFRKLLYSKTKESFEKEIIDHELTKKYPNFLSHLERQYLDRLDNWALYYHYSEDLPTRNVQTSNYVEASFRVRKDIQFHRTKAYKVQLKSNWYRDLMETETKLLQEEEFKINLHYP